MPLTESDLKAIEDRNARRRELKEATSKGPWEYDSWAYVQVSEEIPLKNRLAILIRPEEWFRALGSRIDDGTEKYMHLVKQAYADASFVIESRSDPVDEDIEVLISEVRRLSK